MLLTRVVVASRWSVANSPNSVSTLRLEMLNLPTERRHFAALQRAS